MFSLEFEDEEESHFYLILKAGSFHLMLDMHLCNVQSCKRSYASQPLRYAKNYIFGNKQTDPNMCYMSSNKVNFAFQMTQDYLILLLSMNDANNNINVPIFQKKDSTWQIPFSKERNELERLYVKNAFSISCVKMVNSKQEEEQQSLEKKEETPIHFLIVVFGLFFFQWHIFPFFSQKKKLLPLVYGFGLILKSVFSSISSPAPPSTGFFLWFPSLSFFFFWYQKLLVLIPKVFPYKKQRGAWSQGP